MAGSHKESESLFPVRHAESPLICGTAAPSSGLSAQTGSWEALQTPPPPLLHGASRAGFPAGLSSSPNSPSPGLRPLPGTATCLRGATSPGARPRPFAAPSPESPESPPVVPAAAVRAKPREHPVPLAPEALSVCPPARSPPALLHVPRASPARPPHRAMNHGPRAQVAGRMQPGVRTGLDVKPEGDGDDGHARSSE